MAMNSPIRVNHVGFMCTASKKFVYLGENESRFSVDCLQDIRLTKVYEGILEENKYGELSKGFTGDFSCITEPGIYRINCGGMNSRCFIIYDKVYDVVMRVLSNYLTWQRCASSKGWNGPCHLDDSIKMPDARIKDLAGGHHQSCDTRKWAWGTSLGAIGLIEYALSSNPQWDSGEICDEIRWSCDYFINLLHDEGYLIDCTFVPEGWLANTGAEYPGFGDYGAVWKKRQFYLRPAPAPAHWNTIRLLALAARFFSQKDPEYSAKCINFAKRIWIYITGVHGGNQTYTLPRYPPLGHDGMSKLFQGFYEGSSLNIAGMLCAAIELYKATEDAYYAEIIPSAATKLCSMQVEENNMTNLAAGCFWESEESDRFANNYFYFYNTYIPLGLVDTAALFPDHIDTEKWLGSARKISDQYVFATQRNPFGRLPGTWFANGEDVFGRAAFFSFSTNETNLKDDFPAGHIASKVCGSAQASYRYFSFCYNLDLIAGAVFLLKMHALLKNSNYRDIAFRQIDWLLGLNPYDASSVEGVGYNQPHRGVFGEFFPPVPQIPGAVFTGITAESYNPKSYGLDCEYDMPMVTWLMYLLALLTNGDS